MENWRKIAAREKLVRELIEVGATRQAATYGWLIRHSDSEGVKCEQLIDQASEYILEVVEEPWGSLAIEWGIIRADAERN